MTMLLRDAINIPDHVSASDFVLKLDAGVEHASTTVAQYTVTEKLAGAFTEALDSLQSALTSGSDRGTFIHGSFGTGKSHFMAILDLLITGNAEARALAGLQSTIAQHEKTLNAQVLTLDFHLIGAESLESALFSGYLRQIETKHPDAPQPILHNTEALFTDAHGLRQQLGDESFFDKLNSSVSSDWGSFGGNWTPETYDAATTAPLDDDGRMRLAAALVSTYFPSYVQAGQWVGIDEGLKLITTHAHSLG